VSFLIYFRQKRGLLGTHLCDEPAPKKAKPSSTILEA
jgi:hypothetical protein